MTTPRHRGGLPETLQRFLASLPRHGDPIVRVWNRLAELERACNDPAVIERATSGAAGPSTAAIWTVPYAP
jgi:hypothetical protein